MRFADLRTGAVIDGGRRIVSAEEIIAFAQRYDPQWFHTDPGRAEAGRWKGLIASGWLTCSIAMELAVTSILRDSESIGSPGIEQLRWPAPLRPGDEVRLTVSVLESHTSRSGGTGIVRWQWQLATGDSTVVLDMLVTSLFDLSCK